MNGGFEARVSQSKNLGRPVSGGDIPRQMCFGEAERRWPGLQGPPPQCVWRDRFGPASGVASAGSGARAHAARFGRSRSPSISCARPHPYGRRRPRFVGGGPVK